MLRQLPLYQPFLLTLILIHVPFLWVQGMALYPFVLIRHRHYAHDARLLNHERIHLRQQLELFILPFYICYLTEYLAWRWRGLAHRAAYYRISFEKEAYANEADLNYLRHRRRWNFWRYRA